MTFSWGFALSVAWAAYLVVLAVWIVLQKRSPLSTLSWLLSMGALPYVGFFIYYIFGPQKIERRRLNRKQSQLALESHRRYWVDRVASEHLAPAKQQMARLIYNTTGYPPSLATNYKTLSGGRATFTEIFAAIGEAKRFVHLEYYIYERDATGIALRDLLVAKAREGVRVRLLVDALGSRNINKRFMAPLIDAGGELQIFHATSFRRIRPVLNMRTHRKIVVCDGEVGFTGGVNVTDEGDLARRPDAYHDLHLRVDGPAVYWLQQMFLEDWHYTCGEIADETPSPDLHKGHHLVHIIPSGPDNAHAPLLRAMMAAINESTQRIWLTTPYFVPDEPALFALISAALRGVDVRILVPHRSDNLIVTLAARSWFGELLRAGARIWEYGPRMLHAKTLLVDEDYSFVGTANFDNRSFRLNFELAVLSYDASAAQELANQFENDMLDAEEVRIGPVRRPMHQRLPEALARLAAPLL